MAVFSSIRKSTSSRGTSGYVFAISTSPKFLLYLKTPFNWPLLISSFLLNLSLLIFYLYLLSLPIFLLNVERLYCYFELLFFSEIESHIWTCVYFILIKTLSQGFLEEFFFKVSPSRRKHNRSSKWHASDSIITYNYLFGWK